DLDGREATRRLRSARGAKPDRPWIIALTASAMQDDRERAMAAGMNDFLTKPIRTDALSQALIREHAACGLNRPAAMVGKALGKQQEGAGGQRQSCFHARSSA